MSLPFLVEIGTEELPPKALKSLYESFATGIESGLRNAGLKFEKIHAFGAPRRLAVLVENLALRQPDQQIEKLGPAVANAFDAEGKPTKAAEGFARSNGIEFEQLQRVQTDKGERLVFRSKQEGKFAIDLLPEIVAASLDKLPIPKRMRWGAKRAEFVRPVHWLVMLQGKQVIDAEILGIKAGRETRGHRFHANRAFALGNAQDYQLTLENEAYVIADFNERRGKIRAQVEAAGKKLNGVAVIDEDLLDEVTGLVEWPVALAGKFEERFLAVPQEALISSMKEHQKYFHVVDANGKLLPHFITVSNIESKDPAKVIDGNERVIRPRLSDAEFFFLQDRKVTLSALGQNLGAVTFAAGLGSIEDKVTRLKMSSTYIGSQLHFSKEKLLGASRASELCKCDLLSQLVGEFPELQGRAGYYYAQKDGESAEVADAIFEHYLPRFSGDELPSSDLGIVLSLADKLDTIIGLFGTNQPPTGSKDPFALRRQAISVLRIIIEKGLNLNLRELVEHSIRAYREESQNKLPNPNAAEDVLTFFSSRLRPMYEDLGIRAEVVMAVQAKNIFSPLDINQRVHAVHRFSQLPEADALAAANKRVSNILAKANLAQLPALNSALLSDGAERELGNQIGALAQKTAPLFAQRKYREGLEQLASLRGTVDKFFDEVMVMVDDEAVRNNRLALLSQLRNLFLEVADISLLAPANK
jgi:glycyl-tRNA synthetase beta chain